MLGQFWHKEDSESGSTCQAAQAEMEEELVRLSNIENYSTLTKVE